MRACVSVCVSVCVHSRVVRACVHSCVTACVCVCARARVRVCAPGYWRGLPLRLPDECVEHRPLGRCGGDGG